MASVTIDEAALIGLTVETQVVEINVPNSLTIGGGGGGSGTVDHVSNVATGTILGRATAGTGNSEELTASQARTVMGLGTAATTPASDYLQAGSGFNTADGWLKLDGDGTVPDNRIPASIARDTEIAVDVVSNVATSRILGRTTAGSGDSEELTAAEVKTLLALVAGDIPDLDAAKIISGSLAAARLGLAPHAGLYGTGADGDVTISGATTVVSDSTVGFKHYHNLTINSGQTLTASGLIFVSGTLTRTGAITAPGSNGSAQNGGAGGLGPHYYSALLSPGGGSGLTTGSAGLPTSNPSLGAIFAGGGRGGTGGTGSSGAGGVAGVLPSGLTIMTDIGLRTNLLYLLLGLYFARTTTYHIVGAGTGGGGGGGGGGTTGGGGGGGGGALIIVARHVTGSGAITAPGGDGTTRTGNTGGGGGGGGGLVCVVTGDTSLDTTNISAPGGTGGAGSGTGTAGANGSAGNVITYLGVS